MSQFRITAHHGDGSVTTEQTTKIDEADRLFDAMVMTSGAEVVTLMETAARLHIKTAVGGAVVGRTSIRVGTAVSRPGYRAEVISPDQWVIQIDGEPGSGWHVPTRNVSVVAMDELIHVLHAHGDRMRGIGHGEGVKVGRKAARKAMLEALGIEGMVET